MYTHTHTHTHTHTPLSLSLSHTHTQHVDIQWKESSSCCELFPNGLIHGACGGSGLMTLLFFLKTCRLWKRSNRVSSTSPLPHTAATLLPSRPLICLSLLPMAGTIVRRWVVEASLSLLLSSPSVMATAATRFRSVGVITMATPLPILPSR